MTFPPPRAGSGHALDPDAAPFDSLSMLEALPHDQRAAVRGRVIEGRGYEELALELGCSELAVRRHLSRGLRTLRLLVGTR